MRPHSEVKRNDAEERPDELGKSAAVTRGWDTLAGTARRRRARSTGCDRTEPPTRRGGELGLGGCCRRVIIDALPMVLNAYPELSNAANPCCDDRTEHHPVARAADANPTRNGQQHQRFGRFSPRPTPRNVPSPRWEHVRSRTERGDVRSTERPAREKPRPTAPVTPAHRGARRGSWPTPSPSPAQGSSRRGSPSVRGCCRWLTRCDERREKWQTVTPPPSTTNHVRSW